MLTHVLWTIAALVFGGVMFCLGFAFGEVSAEPRPGSESSATTNDERKDG